MTHIWIGHDNTIWRAGDTYVDEHETKYPGWAFGDIGRDAAVYNGDGSLHAPAVFRPVQIDQAAHPDPRLFVVTGEAIVDGAHVWLSTARPLADVLAARLRDLDAACASAIAAPVTLTALDNLVNSFAPQWQGVINGACLAAQAAIAAGQPFTAHWDAIDGTHELSAAQVVTLFLAGAAYIQACFAAKAAHQAALLALTDPATVVAHDVASGWPSTTI